jgi:hypothetical protein
MNRVAKESFWALLGLLVWAGCSTGTHGVKPGGSRDTTSTAVASADSTGGDGKISWSGLSKNSRGKTVAKIVVDTSEVPDLAKWGRHAGELCVEWYPKIAVILGVDGFLTNRTVRLYFHKEMGGVANTDTRNGVINISSAYVRGHTNDWGMVVHELTHTVQSFGGRGSATFSAEDIKDVDSLAARLKEHSDAVSQYLWRQLSDAAQKEISAYTTNSDGKELQADLVKEINGIIQTNSLYEGLRREEMQLAGVTLSTRAKALLGQGLQGEQLTRLNRAILEDAYPQAMPNNRGGRRNGAWLTEGIADYVRLGHYEPDTPPPRINPDRAKYTDSYKTTATFFRWIEKSYDKEFVKKVNLALRNGTYSLGLFKQYTGKTIDELWEEFASALRARQKVV